MIKVFLKLNMYSQIQDQRQVHGMHPTNHNLRANHFQESPKKLKKPQLQITMFPFDFLFSQLIKHM